MPELPDVEAMRQYLQATSLHQQIEGVELHAAEVLLEDEARELKKELVGRSFASTRRHGKYLFVALDGEEDKAEAHLVLHFGMTGGLKYFQELEDEPEYDRLLLHFAHGYHLAYQAMRKLGEIQVIDDIDAFIDRRELGPDALDSDFDLAAFQETADGRRAMAKSFLMDQHTIAGIGNVYSDEILFQTGVHPRTKINSLDPESLEDIFHTMKKVLQEAIEVQAQPDQLPESFIIPHRHEDGRCPRCGTDLERVKVSSRSAYFCPNRQQKKET